MDAVNSSDNISTHKNKVYTRASIFWGTFLGGPVVAGYFLGKNFLVLGDAKRAAWSFRIGILVTLAFAVLIGVVPDSIQNHVPESVIPVMYAVFAERYFSQKQNDLVTERLKINAVKQTAWKVVGITILIFALSVIGIFVVGLPLHHLFQSP